MRVCKVCGESIENRGPAARYCRTCAQRKARKEGHLNLINNDSKRKTYGYKAYEILKREAHTDQGNNCIICGWTVEGTMFGCCVVHHIIPVSEGGKDDIDNVAVLCPNCHVLAHQDLITRDELLGLAEIARRSRPDLEEIRKLVNKRLRPLLKAKA